MKHSARVYRHFLFVWLRDAATLKTDQDATCKRTDVPSVISSSEWQKYYNIKENKKKELQELKKKRAEEREKKKKDIEETRKLKTVNKITKRNQKTLNKKRKTEYSSSSDEEWLESGNSLDDISDECNNDDDEENECVEQEEYQDTSRMIKQSDYVIAEFPGQKKNHKYVCIVQKISEKDIEVMAMKSSDQSKTLFKENENDISIISKSQIIEVLEVPKMIIMGDRIKYKFAKPLDVDG